MCIIYCIYGFMWLWCWDSGKTYIVFKLILYTIYIIYVASPFFSRPSPPFQSFPESRGVHSNKQHCRHPTWTFLAVFWSLSAAWQLQVRTSFWGPYTLPFYISPFSWCWAFYWRWQPDWKPTSFPRSSGTPHTTGQALPDLRCAGTEWQGVGGGMDRLDMTPYIYNIYI